MSCEKCNAQMKYHELSYHKHHVCARRVVKCRNEGCKWSGFPKEAAEHESTCLYLEVVCPHCLVETCSEACTMHPPRKCSRKTCQGTSAIA